jgi:hypothetical protein
VTSQTEELSLSHSAKKVMEEKILKLEDDIAKACEKYDASGRIISLWLNYFSSFRSVTAEIEREREHEEEKNALELKMV